MPSFNDREYCDLMGVKWAGAWVVIVCEVERRLHELPYLSCSPFTVVMRVSIGNFPTTTELPTLHS